MTATTPTVADRLETAVEQELEDIREHPASPNFRLCGRNHYWVVAETLILAGDHSAAARAATDMTWECNNLWQTWYDAACLMASCVSLVMRDENLDAKDRSKVARGHASQAVKFLRTAINLGFRELGRITKDPDLEPLLGHSGFTNPVATAKACRQVA